MSQHDWTSSPLGMGWRPPLAPLLAEHESLGFCEIIAENHLQAALPLAIENLLSHGKAIIPHGVSLSLGSAEGPNLSHLKQIRRLCTKVKAPFFSEHIAFVRSGASSVQSLLPVPKTPSNLRLLCDRAKATSDVLGLPLVLENIAQLFTWPDQLLREADWLNALSHHGDVGILLDISNLYANVVNGFAEAHPKSQTCVLRAIEDFFQALDLSRVRYLHVAGGTWIDDFYTDTHGHPLDDAHQAILTMAYQRLGPIPTLLERDHHFTSRQELEHELALVQSLLVQAPQGSTFEALSKPAPLVELSPNDLEVLRELQNLFMRFLLEEGETPYFLSPKDAHRIRTSVQVKRARFLRSQQRGSFQFNLPARLRHLKARFRQWLT